VWEWVASAPERAQAQFDSGSRLMTPGAYGEAVKRFDRAVAISPHLAGAYYERGVAHHLLGDADAAINDLSRAIAEDPNYGEAYTERASILLERGSHDRGNLERALADFTQAVEVEPSANGFYQRGQTYASLGQPDKAIADFDRAIAESPNSPYIYRARAEAKRSLGDMAGYQADRDFAIRSEYGGAPPAWVDQPLPGDRNQESAVSSQKSEK